MRIFSCSVCQQLLFFENVTCSRCGHALAYLPEHRVVSALEPAGGAAGDWIALAPVAKGARYRLCRNGVDHGVCNWALPSRSEAALCAACDLNEIIPNLSEPGALDAWQRLEIAKRRLLYTLLDLGLPVVPRRRSECGLAFSFMQDEAERKVLTGHNDGLITINIAEADDPFRETVRKQLGETYRTLLGHLRHEAGHYYWDCLLRDSPQLPAFRALFGDERADYAAASERHYARGAHEEWSLRFVSAYASMHPWEDWAETFAHYLHMVDTLETARSYGLALAPRPVGGGAAAPVKTKRLQLGDFDDLTNAWFPLTVALNSLNRSMGLQDVYPFVLSPTSIAKLRFVHDLVEARADRERGTAGAS
jgi:hypothetical protein